jgi:hypothetical protein
MIILVILILVQFSGSKEANMRHFKFGYAYPVVAFLNIIMVTFGLWTKQLEEDYEVTKLADKFDDDDVSPIQCMCHAFDDSHSNNILLP